MRLLPCGREVRAGRRGLRAGRALPLLLALRLVRGLRGPLQVPRVPRLPQAPTDAVIDLDPLIDEMDADNAVPQAHLCDGESDTKN